MQRATESTVRPGARLEQAGGGSVSTPGGSVEESLRDQVRTGIENAGMSQAEVSRILSVSTKHLSQMMTGRAPMSLEWAERISAVCGMRVEVVVLKGVRDVQTEAGR